MRAISLADGGTIIERLHVQDEAGRTQQYSIVDSTLPMQGYLKR